MLGFASRVGVGSVDDLKIWSWNTANSSFDIVEHADTFDIDANGRSSNDPAHDAAGNLTFDGTGQYTYDGWNRLVSVAHAYRDGGGTLQSGQAHVTMSYDGRGRRISKSVTNAGQWDCTYHYYYDNDSLVETRNGSNQAIKHHVWGTRYIDELVQVSNVAENGEAFEYTDYWACQDSNYNVLGVVDGSAVLKERYEYTPYGQRTAFFSPGANDVGCYAPTQTSRRATQGGVDKPFAVCEVGHQGLVHDEEIGLVYNRARQLHPGLGRFVQRDPMGYVDALSLYQYVLSDPIAARDPSGLLSCQAPQQECCCVDEVEIVPTSILSYSEHGCHGHRFRVMVRLSMGNGPRRENCKLEWWERTNRPPHPNWPPNTWNDIYNLHPNAFTFNIWNRNNNLQDMPKEIPITDDPCVTEPGLRWLALAIVAKSAEGCNCPRGADMATGYQEMRLDANRNPLWDQSGFVSPSGPITPGQPPAP